MSLYYYSGGGGIEVWSYSRIQVRFSLATINSSFYFNYFIAAVVHHPQYGTGRRRLCTMFYFGEDDITSGKIGIAMKANFNCSAI